jgi:hypothetical protein
MSEPNGLLPLLALDPGGNGRGSAFRFVTTGSLWKRDKDKPYDKGNVVTDEWKELMSENDPIAFVPLGDNKESDPPLIVTDDGHLMLTSSYDQLYYRGNPENPTTRVKDLYGIRGSSNASTAAKKILFDRNGNPEVDRKTGLLITEDYIPPAAPGAPGTVTLGPEEQGREHSVRGQVWIWWYGGDVENAARSYRDYITRYIVMKVLGQERTDENRLAVRNGLSVTIGPAMEGLKHAGETRPWPIDHVDYRRVSFEFRADFGTARIVWEALNKPIDEREGWFQLAWTYRWADMLTGEMNQHSMIVKGLEGLGVNNEGMRDPWRFYRFWSAMDPGEDVPLPRASNDPSQPDALPGMMDDGRRYW